MLPMRFFMTDAPGPRQNSHVCRIRLVPPSTFGSIAMGLVILFGRDRHRSHTSRQYVYRLDSCYGFWITNSGRQGSNFVFEIFLPTLRSHDPSQPLAVALRDRSPRSLRRITRKANPATKSESSRRGGNFLSASVHFPPLTAERISVRYPTTDRNEPLFRRIRYGTLHRSLCQRYVRT